MKYFVLFKAEHDGDMSRNDVIDLNKEIKCVSDVEDVEILLSNKWFGDDREVVLLNFFKL